MTQPLDKGKNKKKKPRVLVDILSCQRNNNMLVLQSDQYVIQQKIC